MTINPETDAVGQATLAVCVFPVGSGCSPRTQQDNRPFDRQYFDIELVSPAFHRLGNAFDVNGDGELTSADAFAVINTISRAGDTITLGFTGSRIAESRPCKSTFDRTIVSVPSTRLS